MGLATYDFSSRRVLVSGGARGLGLLVARAFAEAGAQVSVTGTHSLTSYYDSDLTGFRYQQLDLTDDHSIAALARRVDRIDVLVNAAGSRLLPGVDAGEREFITQAVRLGLVGPLQLATRLRLTLAHSAMRGGGAVINLPCLQRWFELGFCSETAAAEAATATRRIGHAWGPTGVRVNSISAALAIPSQPDRLRVQIERHSGPLLTRTQTRAETTQREIVDVALFLASSGAAGISGHTLMIGAPAVPAQ